MSLVTAAPQQAATAAVDAASTSASSHLLLSLRTSSSPVYTQPFGYISLPDSGHSPDEGIRTRSVASKARVETQSWINGNDAMASPVKGPRVSTEEKSINHATSRAENEARENTTDNESPKRKSSEAASEQESSKKKRRKVNHACVYCRRSHMTCDLERPCARCVKRDIGHLCHDEPREPPKRGKSDVGVAEIAPAPEDDKANIAVNGNCVNGSATYPPQAEGGFVRPDSSGNAGPIIAQPSPLSPNQLQRSLGASGMPQNFDWNNRGVHNQFQDMHHLHPNYMFNTSEATNEYNLLNDFLSSSLLDDGALYNNDDAQTLFNDPLLATSNLNNLSNSLQQRNQQQQSLQPPSQVLGQDISRPSSTFPVSDKARDKFYMTAADPAGLAPAEDRLHKLLKAKYDAGMLKPFNYVRGYARLNTFMSRYLSRDSQIRILKQLDRFRPKFREAMHSLTDMQLVLVEMWFERSLMEYDRVFASMAIPACCWRRTGEIFRGNREMAELIDVPMERLRDGRLTIHEIIAEDSLVSYWEKFGAIAFDQSQKAILTSCSLKTPTAAEKEAEERQTASRGTGAGSVGEDTGKPRAASNTMRCCFSFTIRRDTHNIPSLIVGNFLPIRARKEQ
ncbi:regulator of drug sensitivity 2 [Acrodontium crateriforme]|uniref:Regulator of drug sensitivity 2 n=1 Tax=Acrodontium crateriforme TaxID=150365 RepID=A0AAQ3M5R8_9PEZI|nr:regulator of drug sensitivity 2 [Acrodontium crateriforme]